jgi:hypothetical protein
MAFVQVKVGDHVVLRRAHPCGGTDWIVTRTGADIGLRCATCGRRVLLDREEFERRVCGVSPGGVARSGKIV